MRNVRFATPTAGKRTGTTAGSLPTTFRTLIRAAPKAPILVLYPPLRREVTAQAIGQDPVFCALEPIAPNRTSNPTLHT
jgi:hypothetical protein